MDRIRETYFQGEESLRKEVSEEELCGDGRRRRTSQARRKPLVKTQVQEGEYSRDTGLALWLSQWLGFFLAQPK